MSALISRQDAIDAVKTYLTDCQVEDADWHGSGIEHELNNLPSAQPEHTNSWYINSWRIDCKEYDTENKCCPRYNRVIKQTLDDAYRHGETEAEARYHAQQRWIPCSERLPEEDQWLGGSGRQFSSDVLVSILNNDDEDEWVDVSYTIDGKWALELPRHCEILAWMPLPEPYREEGEADGRD